MAKIKFIHDFGMPNLTQTNLMYINLLRILINKLSIAAGPIQSSSCFCYFRASSVHENFLKNTY